jgi:putative transposase
MARPLRIEYARARYHVMSRGDRREPIFHDEKDRQQFLRTLGQTCEKTGWQVHAYCLMSNHFHLVLETPQVNLAEGSKTRRRGHMKTQLSKPARTNGEIH